MEKVGIVLGICMVGRFLKSRDLKYLVPPHSDLQSLINISG